MATDTSGVRVPRHAIWIGGLLASTVLASQGALAQTSPGAPNTPTEPVSSAPTPSPAPAATPALGEVVVTAERRAQSIQSVPADIQALDTRKLTQLNVQEFQDYVKYTPSVTFQTQTPSQTSVYMRGVSSGDNANHSGPLPSVGVYLDEQPITTIGGTIDVHAYDLARIEVLPGPQGTLYGASSEAGTLRIITNKPSAAGFAAGYEIEGNDIDHGEGGYVLNGFVNQPLGDRAAIRLVAWNEKDGGYIDNVPGTRTFATSGATISNAAIAKQNFNPVDTYGGRAALKIDLDKNWTIEPTIFAQDQRVDGIFGYQPDVGDLETNRFQQDRDHDRFYQAAMTVTGKVGNLALVYSGGYFERSIDSRTDYTDYSIFYDAIYGSGVNWQDSNGDILKTPQQYIVARDHFTKRSNELRIVSPASDRLHFIAGLFEERQTHQILQDYQIQGFGDQLAVPGWPNTIWLTDQMRIDRDAAVYTDATFDITHRLSLTAGVRGYAYRNSLQGFYGFGAGYNALTGYTSGEGVGDVNCQTFSHYHGTPCMNLNKTVAQSGETHRVNLTYKFDPTHLIYFTYSTGFRPGGVNRNGNLPPYQADTLSNYEVGFKTQWFERRLTFDGALYYEDWNQFQFSFLGLNSLTVIENAPSADIKGVELTSDWQATQHLLFSGGLDYNDARLSQNFCGADPATGAIIPSCSNVAAVAVKGSQLPYTPEVKGDITARYTFELFGWAAHAQAAGFYQTKNYAGLRTNDVQHLGTMPSYASADFSVGAERNGLSIEGFIKNAFDKRGQENRYTPCTVNICAATVPGIPHSVYVVPIQPMTIGLRLAQKF